MADPVRSVGVEPVGDDQKFKRELVRVLEELIARQAADRTDIDYLKRKVS